MGSRSNATSHFAATSTVLSQASGKSFMRLAHFLFGLHVELVVLELHAVRLVDRGTGADAQHDVLGLGVFLQQVVEVVGGDGLESRGLRHAGELVVQLGLGEAGVGADALVLQLDVEVALIEAAGELTGPFHGVVEAGARRAASG